MTGAVSADGEEKQQKVRRWQAEAKVERAREKAAVMVAKWSTFRAVGLARRKSGQPSPCGVLAATRLLHRTVALANGAGGLHTACCN